MIKKYIKQVIYEALSKDPAHKAHIKSLFEAFIKKFSASYMHYREYKYPQAWPIKSIKYSKDYQTQHIKLLFNKTSYNNDALIFEHEGSIYVVNDKALPFPFALSLDGALALPFPLPPATAFTLPYWHERNYLFKLSVSEFQTAIDVADNYGEFIALCEQLNIEPHKQQE